MAEINSSAEGDCSQPPASGAKGRHPTTVAAQIRLAGGKIMKFASTNYSRVRTACRSVTNDSILSSGILKMKFG